METPQVRVRVAARAYNNKPAATLPEWHRTFHFMGVFRGATIFARSSPRVTVCAASPDLRTPLFPLNLLLAKLLHP